MVIRGMLNMDVSISSIPALIGVLLDKIRDKFTDRYGWIDIPSSHVFSRTDTSLLVILFCAS